MLALTVINIVRYVITTPRKISLGTQQYKTTNTKEGNWNGKMKLALLYVVIISYGVLARVWTLFSHRLFRGKALVKAVGGVPK